MVPATVNEMLLQGHEGIIRLFPCWNKKNNASFENLRADGAFLVSAKLENETISSIKIKSLRGRSCTVECPGINSVIRETDKEKIEFKKEGKLVTFKTQANTVYKLI